MSVVHSLSAAVSVRLPLADKYTVTVQPNYTNFRAETTPAGGRCRKHSFFFSQKMDDTLTAAAAEAPEGTRLRTDPTVILHQSVGNMGLSPVSHSSAARAHRHIYPLVSSTGGKQHWSVTCGSGGRRNFNLIQLLLGSHSDYTSFFKMSVFFFFEIPSALPETHISYMKNFNEMSVHVGWGGSLCTSDERSWPSDRFKSNKAFQVSLPTHWCHVFGKSISVRTVGSLLKPVQSGWRQTSTAHRMVKYTESAESFGGEGVGGWIEHFTSSSSNQVRVEEKQRINSVFLTILMKKTRKKNTWGLSTAAPGERTSIRALLLSPPPLCAFRPNASAWFQEEGGQTVLHVHVCRNSASGW